MQNEPRNEPRSFGQNDKETDSINAVKSSGCSVSFNYLIEAHSAIFYKIYGKYSQIMSAYGYEKCGIESDKNLVFFTSIRSYKFNKNSKFSTWLANQTRFFCLNFINKQKKTIFSQRNILHELKRPIIEENNEDSSRENKIDLLNALSCIRDNRIKEIFKYRYLTGKMPWALISKKINASMQTVHNLHSEGKRILRKNLTK